MQKMRFVAETVTIWTDVVCAWSSLADPDHVVQVVVLCVVVVDTAGEEDMVEIMEVVVEEVVLDLVDPTIASLSRASQQLAHGRISRYRLGIS
ncbi:hypothetical protein KIN20_003471 [Parelaphostrongylus tenuis]|uniref:Uncharacterized protein n=1 Tax=Parelaphostrongylus tenuis TaxID=148309 RepID=A0AAD5MFN4_PARTN|nr:hypothetical protein KIN20_003471 [Parelaphostrongylus tenuis]